MNTARLCVSLRQWNAIAAIDIFYNNKKKKENSYDRFPNPDYFNIPLLMIYLSAIGQLFVIQKLRLTGSTSFEQNTLRGFQNTVLNSWWHCYRRMPQTPWSTYMARLIFRQIIYGQPRSVCVSYAGWPWSRMLVVVLDSLLIDNGLNKFAIFSSEKVQFWHFR